ncbi:AMP-dependent synthetase/ligase [Aquabacterium sp.]|uniref:AMP-dependent synthetase/ligase n=1 Tax=Aquabacterium TaxID=92793 RepID=UPI001D8265DA|nr:AMP-dependent synthetase/ligase [Aquabacterium sp.]MBT9609958.1 long-chain fatty acid--CoA ligase [Aquabacterium sp.]
MATAHAHALSAAPTVATPPLAAYDGFVSPPQLLLNTAQRLGTHPAYCVRTDAGWQATSWEEHGRQVRDAGKALIGLGVKRGDAVAILSFNTPQWVTLAFAAMAIGATPVGIYWTSSPQDIAYILNHCKASVLLVDEASRLQAVQACKDELPHLRHTVMLRDIDPAQARKPVMSWDAFMQLGKAAQAQEFEQRLQSLSAHDIGTLIYTSGTTGPAKAVALSQGNLWWVGHTMQQLFNVDERDRVISYLPLAHIAEQMNSMHNQAHSGFTVYYARSMEELGDHLKEVRPTIFFGVPRVWEKMQSGIEARLAQATGVKAALARWAMSVGQRWHALDHAGQPAGPWLTLQKQLAHRLVHRKVKEALGLDQARLLSSGAAPIAPEKLRFFAGLDVVVRELYGQSEVTGPSTLSLPGSTRVGSVGKPLPGTEITVAEDGELRVRGPHLFQCYMGSPQATAESFSGEWLLTGDLGHIDEDGYVFITGRKKDLIITSGGKNISPANIETALMDAHLVEHAVVCGDGRNYLVALLTLDPVALAAFASQHGLLDEPHLHEHPLVLQTLQADIDHVNASQARVAQVRKFAVLPQSLSVASGELTPTLKVKRKVVLERNQALIELLYRNGTQ